MRLIYIYFCYLNNLNIQTKREIYAEMLRHVPKEEAIGLMVKEL